MEWIEEIKNDNLSGAAELARQAAGKLVHWAHEWPGESIESLKEEAFRSGRELIEAQPVMVPLRQLVNRVLNGLEEAEDVARGKEAICQAAQGFDATLEKSVRKISDWAAGLIRDGHILLTHSYSSTLLAGLLRMKEAGRRFEVICTESRPRCEGWRLAEKLAEAGIRVTLIADGAAFQLLSRMDLILVGGDALTPAGLINKIGTRGLALAARGSRPFYALCSSEKFWPQPLSVLLEEQTREPQELWPHPPLGVRVWNFYFDQTPLEHLTAIVTQEGILSPSEALAALKGIAVHPRLALTG